MNLTDDVLDTCAKSTVPLIAALAAEVIRLRAGIRTHRQKTGHELCWLNDVELWKLLEPGATYPHETLPVREEFLSQCARFYESRLRGTPYEEPASKQTIVPNH